MTLQVNPYGGLSWDEYVADDGDVFLQTNLYRVHPRTGVDELIARITEVATTDWWDYLAFPGPNTWKISATVDRSGAIIEGPRVEASATLSFRRVWLHEVADPSEAVELLATVVDLPLEGSQEWRQAGGSGLWTRFAGTLVADRLALQLAPDSLSDPAQVGALRRFFRREVSHARKLCLRFGALDDPEVGGRWIVNIDGPAGAVYQSVLATGRIAFREVAFSEDPTS